MKEGRKKGKGGRQQGGKEWKGKEGGREALIIKALLSFNNLQLAPLTMIF